GLGIEKFRIIGEAKPGGKLVGYPINGTTLCTFQWVRFLEDDTRHCIEDLDMQSKVDMHISRGQAAFRVLLL
ncbi:hypothetical protein CICLE_v10033391mg, partial [Citrus x clementina]